MWFSGKCLHVCGFDCCKEHYSDNFSGLQINSIYVVREVIFSEKA